MLRTDKTYAFISLAVFGVSTILTHWTGFLLCRRIRLVDNTDLPAITLITCCEGLSIYTKRKERLTDKAITDKQNIPLYLQGIAPYFRRVLVHHLYLLGC